jgi:hypothetical protein
VSQSCPDGRQGRGRGKAVDCMGRERIWNRNGVPRTSRPCIKVSQFAALSSFEEVLRRDCWTSDSQIKLAHANNGRPKRRWPHAGRRPGCACAPPSQRSRALSPKTLANQRFSNPHCWASRHPWKPANRPLARENGARRGPARGRLTAPARAGLSRGFP